MEFNLKTFLLGILICLLSSCGSFDKATSLSPETNYFPAKPKKQATVLKAETNSADSLNVLLVVPNSDYMLQMGKNLNYFAEVMTYEQFQTAIVKEGLASQIPSLSDRVGLSRAYALYRPFVILNTTKVRKPGDGWFAGLVLYHPKEAETIFQNEIWLNLMWDGWTDQGTMYPLFNSLLDYLRAQEE